MCAVCVAGWRRRQKIPSMVLKEGYSGLLTRCVCWCNARRRSFPRVTLPEQHDSIHVASLRYDSIYVAPLCASDCTRHLLCPDGERPFMSFLISQHQLPDTMVPPHQYQQRKQTFTSLTLVNLFYTHKAAGICRESSQNHLGLPALINRYIHDVPLLIKLGRDSSLTQSSRSFTKAPATAALGVQSTQVCSV